MIRFASLLLLVAVTSSCELNAKFESQPASTTDKCPARPASHKLVCSNIVLDVYDNGGVTCSSLGGEVTYTQSANCVKVPLAAYNR